MDKFLCDVCSVVLPHLQLSDHIQLHALQLAQLCKKLRPSTRSLHDETFDIDSDNSTTTENDASTEFGSQQSDSKAFRCPDTTCDHKTFARNQDLVRHYLTRNTSTGCMNLISH
jgi:hypothetical protein